MLNADMTSTRHFLKMHLPRIKKRTQSPHRETVSPAPSYYSEPVYLQHRKDVTRDLPPLPGGMRRRGLDEEDEEETLSLRSMPGMRSSLSHASKVKRSWGFPKRHVVPELRLPPVTKIHPDPRTHEPLRQERPPGGAGYRPEKQGYVPPGPPEKEAVGLKKQGDVPPGPPEKEAVGLKKSFNNKEDLLKVPVVTTSKIISDPPPPKTQRITFHSPVVQAVYPITPDNDTQTRKPEEDRKPPYPRVLSSTSTCAISNTIGPQKVYIFEPHLLRDNPPPYSSEWTDPKALTQGRTEWTEPRAPTQGRREVLLIRLGITWSKAESSSNLRQPQSQSQLQRCPIRPLKPALRRLPIPNTGRLRGWGRQGTTLGCLWEEEGCLPPPVPVHPVLLEPFTGRVIPGFPRFSPKTLQTPCSTLLARTVQLTGSQGPGGALPRITMTRPTPPPSSP
ncbi:unnamed protein product, partial [Coregonus sp. 'balchen']